MNTKAIVTGIVSLLILIAGGYYYSTINVGEKETTTVVTAPTKKSGIVVLADGTYSNSANSNNANYIVPKLDTTFMRLLIDQLRFDKRVEVAYLYISYVDDKNSDNEVISFEVTKANIEPLEPMPKVQDVGYIKISKEKEKWEQNRIKHVQDSLDFENQFMRIKSEFLRNVQELLDKKVYVKSPRNQRTDAKQAIISSERRLQTAISRGHVDYSDAFIIAFSDLENSPACDKISVSKNIHVCSVISQPGVSNTVVRDCIELASKEETLKFICDEK